MVISVFMQGTLPPCGGDKSLLAPSREGKLNDMAEPYLDTAAAETLVGLVAQAVEAAIRGGPVPPETLIRQAMERHPRLAKPAGAFVTLYVNGHLRGCLGEMEPRDSLAQVAIRCAQRTPLYDYRFDPVRPDEIEDLSFKISVLTPLEPLRSVDDIRIGEDGLLVRHGHRQGVLLPDVPLEYGWDVPTYLKHLWRKAGIDDAVPVDRVELWRFGSQVIQGRDWSSVRA